MSLRAVLGAVALLMLCVLAGWVWSAEEGEAPAEAAAPAEAEEAPAEAEAAPAEAEAEAEAAPGEAEAEAEEAPEKVQGWLCEVKMTMGGRQRSGTLKLTPTRMYREGVDGVGRTVIGDAELGVTYIMRARQTPGPRGEGVITVWQIEKYPWSEVDGKRRAMLDSAIQDARMGLRGDRRVREAFQKQIDGFEAFKKPAKLEATEETKTIGDYECVKYTLTQGGQAEGVVWVTKDIEVDAPLGALLAHSAGLGREGGLPFLQALDELDDFPLRVNVQYYVPGRRSVRKFNFWFEKVSEAEFELAELEPPPEAEIRDATSGRGARRRSGRGREGSRRGPEPGAPGIRR